MYNAFVAWHPPTKSKTTKRSKPKTPTRTHLTDKQRQQWAREHYELNHQFPAILGHHQPQQQFTPLSPLPQHEQTLLQPPTTHTLLQHLGNETDHQLLLLQQLDMMMTDDWISFHSYFIFLDFSFLRPDFLDIKFNEIDLFV